MKMLQLALKNIAGSPFRSWIVALCAFLVTGFAVGTVLFMSGAESSLELANARMGADIVVVPEGTVTKLEGALLMGTTARIWMPRGTLDQVAAVPGVAAVTPQLYLSTLIDAACCSVSDMFMIAYDPETDFTLTPWLQKNVGDGLHLGEAVGGTYVFVPEGEQNIKLYGYFITLKANLEPTGSALDQTMFLTFETAEDIARVSQKMALEPLVIPEDSISSVLVKLKPGADHQAVALDIMHKVPGVTPIPNANMFRAYRTQIEGLKTGVVLAMGLSLILSVMLIALIFAMAAGERRQEMGVLRALGATRRFVFSSLLAEAGVLALGGGLAGALLTVLVTCLFRRLIITSMGVPFLLPSPAALAAEVIGGLGMTLASISLAAFVPAMQVSHQEPAAAMRS